MTKKLFPLVLAFLLGCTDIPSDICEKTEIPSSSSSDDGSSSSSSDVGGSSSSEGGGSSSSSDVGSSSSSDDGGSSSSSDVGGSSSSDDGGSSSSAEELPSSSSAVPVPQHTLIINIDPTAGGTVTRNPAKTSYDHGTEVIVTAEPEAGYAFAGWWSGATLVEEAIEYAVEMDGDKTLTAKFELIPPNSYLLEIHVNDVHGGTVHHSPSGATHVSGTAVTVTAEPEFGYEFTGWSGDATSTDNPIEITMDGNKVLTANFEQLMSGIFTDSRDGQSYKWVRIIDLIGTPPYNKIWMAKNLNYDVPENETDVCYENNPSNCETYGRLYNWATAIANCPEGWQLPSDAEWTALITAVGSNSGTKLKATSGWNAHATHGNGTDEYGFSALPGGMMLAIGFRGIGEIGGWWSRDDSFWPPGRRMYHDESIVTWNEHQKGELYSVRCVKD